MSPTKQGKSTTVRPLDDRVVIRAEEPKSVTAGGIVIPDLHQDLSTTGTVVAVGPGKLLESGARAALGVKPGDKVMFGRFAGTEIKLDDGTGEMVGHWIMRVSEILAVL